MEYNTDSKNLEIVSSYDSLISMAKDAIKINSKINKITYEMSLVDISIKDIELLLENKENIHDYEKAMELLKELKKCKDRHDKSLNKVTELEEKLTMLKKEIIETIDNI